MAYGFFTAITIQSSAVAANETDFPVALVLTDARFATTGNGGHVENTDAGGGASGALTVPADFVVSPNTDGSSPYDFEFVDYNAVTGYLELWVEIPSLSSVGNTTIYLVYGDAGVAASQEDVAGTWGDNYVGVWHCGEASGALIDSTANGLDATYGGSTSGNVYGINGQVGSCIDFDGNDWFDIGDVAILEFNNQDWTVQAWIKVQDVTINSQRIVQQRGTGAGGAQAGWNCCLGDHDADDQDDQVMYNSIVDDGSEFVAFGGGSSYTGFLPNQTWALATWVYEDEVSFRGYLNDAQAHVSEVATAVDNTANTRNATIGCAWDAADTQSQYFDGLLDEIRISTGVRDTDWITTTYNNMSNSAPDGSFWGALGVENGGAATRSVDAIIGVAELGLENTRFVDAIIGVVELAGDTWAISQFGAYVEYHTPPEETGTQIRGWDQIQPGSVQPDRLAPDVAGDGLGGGGEVGALYVDINDALFWPPTAQGQAVVSNGAAPPAWTASLTPTWLGQHTFNAGLVIPAAQAITMGDESYIGCGPADVRIVFDAGNDIALLGGNVGIGTSTSYGALEISAAQSTTLMVRCTTEAVAPATSRAILEFLTGSGAPAATNRLARIVSRIVDAHPNPLQADLTFSVNAGDNLLDVMGLQADGDVEIMAGSLGLGTASPDRLIHAEVADAATNVVAYAQRLSHTTSNTAVPGFGVGLEFELEENDGTNKVAGIIEVKWSDAGAVADADAYFDFLTMLNDGAAASRMVVGYNGYYVGIGTPTPARILHVYHASLNTVARFESGDATMTIELIDGNTTGVGHNTIKVYGNEIAIGTNNAERMRFADDGNIGMGTDDPDRLIHGEVADSATNTIVYAERLSHVTDGTVAALFGVGWETELEDAGGNNRVASMYDTLWADPAAASYTSLLRWQNTHIGTQGGYGGFVALNDVAGVAMPVVPNGAGDVTVTLTVLYSVSESDGGTAGGTATVLNNSSVELYTDGVDTLTLAVAADGSVTLQRTAGAATFDVSLWMTWL